MYRVPNDVKERNKQQREQLAKREHEYYNNNPYNDPLRQRQLHRDTAGRKANQQYRREFDNYLISQTGTGYGYNPLNKG